MRPFLASFDTLRIAERNTGAAMEGQFAIDSAAAGADTDEISGLGGGIDAGSRQYFCFPEFIGRGKNGRGCAIIAKIPKELSPHSQ